MSLKPHDRLRYAASIVREVYTGEDDQGIRINLSHALSSIGNAAIQLENREDRLMRKAFGPKEEG